MRFLLLILLLAQCTPDLCAQPAVRPKLRYDPPQFDSVQLAIPQYKGAAGSITIIDWPVKNISNDTVLFPELIDVWNDCPISDRFANSTPLPPGKERVVHFRLNWYRRMIHWHVLVGNIHMPATYLGRDTDITIPVSIRFYEDSTFFNYGTQKQD